MLSTRIRIMMTIAAIAAAVIAANTGIALYVSQTRFINTLDDSLVLAGKISSGLIAGELKKLRAQTISAAEQIAVSGDVQKTLEEQIKEKRESPFLTFSVLSRDGILLYAGDSGSRPLIRARGGEYGRRAFAGETVIAPTAITPEGHPVIRIWTPVDEERILAASFSGLHLGGLIAPYRLWESGEIFVVDRDGVIIATNGDWEAVLERRNYIEWGVKFPEYRRMSAAFRRFTENDAGTEQYSRQGKERLCAYQVIDGTDHWTVAVSASLEESPFSEIRDIFFLYAMLILILGIAAARLASDHIIPQAEKTEIPDGESAREKQDAPVSPPGACETETEPPGNTVSEKNAPGKPEASTKDAPGVFKNAVIPGINIAGGLEMIGDDEETYLMILRAYAAHTPAVIETVRTSAPDNIQDYHIAVHGLKGSSKNIGADELGNQAEKLENAAKNGDLAFIAANTEPFIKAAKKIVDDIKTFLQNSAPGGAKPMAAGTGQ